MFASKQAKASTILASENSTLHKRAILPKFTEYLTHALNSFYQAVFSAPAKTDWERGYIIGGIYKLMAVPIIYMEICNWTILSSANIYKY